MSARLDDEPWGAARFFYAYLGALLAALFGGLLAAIAYPVLQATPLCRDDAVGLCLPAMSVLVWSVATAAGVFLAGYLFRLGWQWAAWVIGLALVLGQVVVESNSYFVALLVFLLPALATVIAFRRPDRDPPRWMSRVRHGALIVVVLQCVVWFVVLLVAPL